MGQVLWCMKKMVELQMEQNRLVLKIVGKRQFLRDWKEGEPSRTIEGYHLSVKLALEHKRRYEREIEEEVGRFNANQNHLNKVLGEIDLAAKNSLYGQS